MLAKKGFLYKSLILLLSAIFVFTLSACGGKESSSGNAEPATTTGNSAQGTEEDDVASSESDVDFTDVLGTETDYSAMFDAGAPPVSVGITKYMEVKGKAYEMLDPVMNNISSMNPMAGFGFLPLVTMDLSILPLTMIGTLPKTGDNEWDGQILFLMQGTGHSEVRGNINSFTLEVEDQNNPGKTMKIEGEYDMDKDSMYALFTVSDGSQMIFEFTASGNGYVSQLYSKSEAENTVIKNAFETDKLYAGMLVVDGAPDRIYQRNITDWEAFVKSDTLMVILENGKGFTILDGERYEH